MTKLMNLLVFLFILGLRLARSSGLPDSSYNYWDENGLSRNPIRELYRRNTVYNNQLGDGRRSRKEAQVQTQAQTQAQAQAQAQAQKIKQENSNRAAWEIFEKLRNSNPADAAHSQPSSPSRNQQSPEQGAKRGEFVSNDPKYMLQDTSSYQQAIKSLQDILKGYQVETTSATNILYSKGKAISGARTSRKKRKPEKKLGRGSRSEKAYLDYTNSMMPFNEGTKISEKEQEKDSKSEETQDSKQSEGSDYARVRRYLDHGRVMNLVKGSSTLEAKEAAMSRVLDPNLNLDGILEPHVCY